jgi:hypothetical protein
LPGDPVIVRCKSEHHRPNRWIVSFFGERPHFLGLACANASRLEEIPTVRDALASHDLLPVSLQKPVLTSGPTNMKISTMASLANALNVDMVVMFVDRSYRGRYFTSIGMHIAPNCNVAFNTDAIHLKDTNVSIGMNMANSATSTFAPTARK